MLVGFDAVLGLPETYLKRLQRVQGWEHVESFPQFLAAANARSEFYEHSPDAPAWRIDRPFFRVPPGKEALHRFWQAAGGRDVLERDVERRTGAKSVFIVGGIPGVVGAGSRKLWQELGPQILSRQRDFVLWPFEGRFHDLHSSRDIVFCEIYPGASYAVALEPTLPSSLRRIAKTKRTARESALKELGAADWIRSCDVSIEGRDLALGSEDAFDAMFSAAALLRITLECRPLDSDLDDPVAEGGIVGVGLLHLPPARRQGLRRPRPSRAPGSPVAQPTKPFACPIPGCDKVFKSGRLGWDAHVASRRVHPWWHPHIADPEERKRLFRLEFGNWLG